MWLYKDIKIKNLNDIPEETFGFVYEVEHLPTGRKYLGKKVLFFKRTLPPLKGKKRKRKVRRESDWVTYYGSHPEIKTLLKENKHSEFKREILIFVKSKKMLTYYENKFLFCKGVVEPNSIYINDNIEGRYFRKDFL